MVVNYFYRNDTTCTHPTGQEAAQTTRTHSEVIQVVPLEKENYEGLQTVYQQYERRHEKYSFLPHTGTRKQNVTNVLLIRAAFR